MTDTGNQPAGWYHAQGDPPGTQRYWDGSQWQGGPQAMTAAGYAYGSGARSVASPGSRFVAYLIDGLIIVAAYIVVFVLVAVFVSISEALGGIVLVLGFLGVIAFGFWNQIWLVGTRGQSIGKRQQGITVLNVDTGEPVGVGMAFVRLLLQGLFSIPIYLDHWWILVDDDNRRLSDKVLGFHVYTA